MNNHQIFKNTFDTINSYINSCDNGNSSVVNFKNPSELSEIIDFSIRKQGVSEEEFMKLISQYLSYSVRTGSKQFLNQLYSGFNFPAFIGDVITSLTNTSMYTYEVAPVATMIEKELVKLMCSYAGYTSGDGIFVSGGSNANLLAMFSARNRVYPEIRNEGCKNKSLIAFVSDQAHYSFDTAANLLGIGSKNLVKIRTDKNGKMILDELEKAILISIAKNQKPFFVGVTCATTILGAYDPINEIAEICQKYNIWLHADGSFGGSVILSQKCRHLMDGIEKTDSFGWNAHKLMNIPLICSVLLVKKRGTLQSNITDINTTYIFHDIDATEDLGKKSIQCGRRVDAVKLWFAWKYFGEDGYSKRIENLIEIAMYAEEIVKGNTKLQLLAPRQSFTVCFRYIPSEETDLNAFNISLREALRKSGKALLNYGYIGKTVTLRLVITNGEMEKLDVDLFFRHITDTALSLEKKNLLTDVEAR